jgi:hypothetical protein
MSARIVWGRSLQSQNCLLLYFRRSMSRFEARTRPLVMPPDRNRMSRARLSSVRENDPDYRAKRSRKRLSHCPALARICAARPGGQPHFYSRASQRKINRESRDLEAPARGRLTAPFRLPGLVPAGSGLGTPVYGLRKGHTVKPKLLSPASARGSFCDGNRTYSAPTHLRVRSTKFGL